MSCSLSLHNYLVDALYAVLYVLFLVLAYWISSDYES